MLIKKIKYKKYKKLSFLHKHYIYCKMLNFCEDSNIIEDNFKIKFNNNLNLDNFY